MQKLSNEQALSFIDSFLTEVHEEKTAEESPITVTTSDTGGEAAGTIPAVVANTEDTSPENTKDEQGNPVQGAFGKEKNQDMNGAVAATGVEDDAAANSEKVDNERAAGDFGQEPTEGAQEERPSYIEVEKMKVAEEINMTNELERAQNLSNVILDKIASVVSEAEHFVPGIKTVEKMLKEAPPKEVGRVSKMIQKMRGAGTAVKDAGKATKNAVTDAAKFKGVREGEGKAGKAKGLAKDLAINTGTAAAGAGVGAGGYLGYKALTDKKKMDKEEAEMDYLVKEAADAAYHDFVTSYEMGLLKRAEDEAAVQEALQMNPEDASAVLDDVAQDNPEAVMPSDEEAVPAADAPAADDDGEDIDEDQLLQALVDAGVTPEDMAAADAEARKEDGVDAAPAEDMEVQAAEADWEALKNITRALR